MDNIQKFNDILSAFKVAAVCRNFSEYKSAWFYDVELRPGGRVRDLQKYSAEFSLALKVPFKPRINVISGDGIIRFEFIKTQENKISLLDLGSTAVRPAGELTCLLGETLFGEHLWIDLVKMPHLLVAGCTGSGKSTLLHAIIANLLIYPKVQICLMDPKSIEFYHYDGKKIPSIKVSYSYDDCLNTLADLNSEMDERYSKIKNSKIDVKTFPYKVVIIDEFADLRLQDESGLFVKYLTRLAQKSRAARIHLVLATQRPSVNVLDGVIKSNFPARLACKVASGIDSRVILDTVGAEDLIGAGDSIINGSDHNYKRFQAAFVDAAEVCEHFNKYGN